MFFKEFLDEDIALLRKRMAELKGLVTDSNDFIKFLEDLEKQDPEYEDRIKDFQSRQITLCDRSNSLLDRMQSSNAENELEKCGLYLAAVVQGLQSEAQSFQEFLVTAQAGGKKTGSGIASEDQIRRQSIVGLLFRFVQQQVVPVIRRVLQAAWQILANLLTPKSWRVKGMIGTSFLGLGNAELEITFE